jgi:hypothetical protein
MMTVMKRAPNPIAALTVVAAIALAMSCATPLRTTKLTVDAVTLSVDAAMKSWADLSVRGKTSPEIDAQVMQRYGDYQRAAAAMEAAMLNYRTNAASGTVTAALSAVSAASIPLIEFVAQLLEPTQPAKAKALRAKEVK